MAWTFFQPRAVDDAIDLQTLIEAADTHPAKRYTNLLLMDMLAKGLQERTLSADEPLPGFEHFDNTLPQFAVVVNRLTVMSGLDPIQYKTPRDGRFDLIVQGAPFGVFARFDDARRTVSIRLQPGTQTVTS